MILPWNMRLTYVKNSRMLLIVQPILAILGRKHIRMAIGVIYVFIFSQDGYEPYRFICDEKQAPLILTVHGGTIMCTPI